MNSLSRLAARPRWVAAAVLAASLFALAAAYIAEYGFGLEPCVLCLYQRIPYAVTAVLAVLALGVAEDSPIQPWVVALCAVAFAVGTAIAFYHVGVEQHWWVSAASCGPEPGQAAGGMSFDAFRAELQGGKPPKPCDVIDWTFLGQSMAVYNTAASALLTAGCGVAATMIRRNRRA